MTGHNDAIKCVLTLCLLPLCFLLFYKRYTGHASGSLCLSNSNYLLSLTFTKADHSTQKFA